MIPSYPLTIALVALVGITAFRARKWLKGKSLKPPDQHKKSEPKEKKKEKLTLWQIIKRIWLIIFAVWVAWWIVLILIIPIAKKTFGIKTSLSQNAVYSWKKLDYQRGYDPSQRSGGPFKAKVVINNAKMLYFIVYSPNGEGYFDGWKKANGEIEGIWTASNPSAGSGGKWILREDASIPGLYRGIETELYLPEGMPCELRLD